MRRADLITGLVVAGVGAYALSMALDLAMFGTHRVPGPGFLPTLLSVLLLVLGLLLAATSLRGRPEPAPAVDPPDSSGAPAAPGGEYVRDPGAVAPTEGRRVLRASTVLLCYAACVPLLTVVGFVVATALLIFGLLFGVEGRRNWRATVAAIVIPVATYILFVNVLTISLPVGLLGPGPLGI
ncbi:MAG TPA: tripartite tricarboxylate transporter TctB family protein [Mycobacteriales bacterium]|nr:tripartite tricarboxylate transporter TctB family protein [Mycobacteriales bacterium]